MFNRSQDVFKTNVFVIDKPSVYVSDYVLAVCNGIQSKFEGTEFSILLKGYWTHKGFECSDHYIIPKQRVTAASVEYEPLAGYVSDGYNVVIHSHHNMGGSFSSTDLEYINSFFPVSILYAQRRFATAQVIYPVEGGYTRYEIPIRMKNTLIVKPKGIENIVNGYGHLDNIRQVVHNFYEKRPPEEASLKEESKPVEPLAQVVLKQEDSQRIEKSNSPEINKIVEKDPLKNRYI